MHKLAILLLLPLIAAAGDTINDPRKHRVVHPFKISTEPAVIERDVPFAATASFTTPLRPGKCGMQARLYDYTDDEPDYNLAGDQRVLSRSDSNLALPPAGRKLQASFPGLQVPQKAADRIYLVVLSSCTQLYKAGKPSFQKMGSATFRANCLNQLCGYRQE